jgi:hypothetical protein
MVNEQEEYWQESAQEEYQELRFLKARLEVYDTLLERRAKGKEMPWQTDDQEDKREPTGKNEQAQAPSVSGYRGPEYAMEAKEIVEANPITSFSQLAREMEEPTVGGESKVDTVKRNIGYDDLPREKKKFPVFREMLLKRVNQLPGEQD